MSDTTDNCVTLNQTVFVVKEKDTTLWEPGTSGSGGYNIRVLQTLSNPRQVVTLSATMEGLVFDFDDTATSGSIVVVERELAVTANVAQEVSMGLAITQGTFVLQAVEEVNGNERLLASVTQQAGDVTTDGGGMHTQSMLLGIVPSTGNIKLRLSTIPMQVGNRSTATGRWITKKTKYLEQQNIAVTLCDSTADRYRFGFNGMEKDNEMKGIGNSLDFGARMYDSRLGRWLSVDPLFKKQPNYSPFKSFLNNPIVFLDPEGETEYYFQGMWIGTDGVNNNYVAKISSKEVADKIIKETKKGFNVFPLAKTNEAAAAFNIETMKEGLLLNVFLIHKDVLNDASIMLNESLNDKGKVGEYSLSMNKSGDNFIKTAPMEYKEGSNTANIPQGDGCISIHSHPTGVDKEGYFYVSDEASNGDENKLFPGFEINIIVGKADRNKVTKDSDNIITDTRKNEIHVFQRTKESIGSFTEEEATKILKGDRGRLGEKFEKNRTINLNNETK